MDKKNLQIVGVLLFIASVCAIAYFCYYRKSSEGSLIDEKGIDELNKTIDISEIISEKGKKDLHELILHFSDINQDIAEQLIKALNFIGMGQMEEALRKLGVLVEHLLTELYKNDAAFQAWAVAKKKQITFGNMVLYCRDEDNRMTASEYGALFFLKELRNEESHLINTKFEEYIQESGLIAAIGTIKKLSLLCYPKQSD